MITPLYAGLLGLLLIYLSFRVIFRRRGAKVSVGDGGDRLLTKRIRTHSNLIEYGPMALILLALAELQGAPAWAVHILGLMLVIGRVMHAYGFGHDPQIIPLRKNGMLITFAMIGITSLANIGHAIF